MTVNRTTIWTFGAELYSAALNNEFNNLLDNPQITNADISTGAAIAYAKLNLGGSVQDSDIASDANIQPSKIDNTAAVLDPPSPQTIQNTILQTPIVDTEFAIGNVSGTENWDWSKGDRQNCIVTGNTILNPINMVAGQTATLWMVQNSTGVYNIAITPTGGANIYWNQKSPPPWESGNITVANEVDCCIIRYDGTNFFGMWGQNFG
jgi:hypothetical protein